MSIPVIAFFNNKGGVGKTSLVYHIAWMLADLGVTVLAADLDPQANLTAAFMNDDLLEEWWRTDPATIYTMVAPVVMGDGDIRGLTPYSTGEALWLVPGDLRLSAAEDEFAQQWPRCLNGEEKAFRIFSALWRALQEAANWGPARVILIDLGPGTGVMNRAALVASDFVVVPLAPDLLSVEGLRLLGPTLRRWRAEWAKRRPLNPAPDLDLPGGGMKPLGYVMLPPSVATRGGVVDRWSPRIPGMYAESVHTGAEPQALGLVKNYRSLMPLAQEARKPVFHLKPADGAIGAEMQAVNDAYRDFKKLALEILRRAGIRAE